MSQPLSAEEREDLRRAAKEEKRDMTLRLLDERDALADNLEQAQSDLKSACMDRDRLAEKLRGYLAASVLQDERVAELTATVEQLRKDREQLNQVRSAHDADVRREAFEEAAVCGDRRAQMWNDVATSSAQAARMLAADIRALAAKEPL